MCREVFYCYCLIPCRKRYLHVSCVILLSALLSATISLLISRIFMQTINSINQSINESKLQKIQNKLRPDNSSLVTLTGITRLLPPLPASLNIVDRGRPIIATNVNFPLCDSWRKSTPILSKADVTCTDGYTAASQETPHITVPSVNDSRYSTSLAEFMFASKECVSKFLWSYVVQSLVRIKFVLMPRYFAFTYGSSAE